MIAFDDFKKVELRAARVIKAERVEESEKLLRLEVDLGAAGTRQIVAGVAKEYAPEQLIGRTIIVITNLQPRTLMKLESNGMLLAADAGDGKSVLLTTMEDVEPGAGIT
jgi:methionyl-tRNA synthetase